MMEIDVSKCEYYNDYYKTCSNFSRFSDDEPYCDPKEFKCSYYVNNIDKQLQQLKAENELLKNERTIDLRNQLEQLKAENEELRKSNTSNAKAFLKENKEKHKLLDCLDEIEEICKVHTDFCKNNKKNCELCPLEPCEDILILQLIKQAKENR